MGSSPSKKKKKKKKRLGLVAYQKRENGMIREPVRHEFQYRAMQAQPEAQVSRPRSTNPICFPNIPPCLADGVTTQRKSHQQHDTKAWHPRLNFDSLSASRERNQTSPSRGEKHRPRRDLNAKSRPDNNSDLSSSIRRLRTRSTPLLDSRSAPHPRANTLCRECLPATRPQEPLIPILLYTKQAVRGPKRVAMKN